MADFNISFLFQAIGAFCIAIAFLPQTISALKAKDTSGLSFICYLIYHIGISCIIFYALQKGYYIILIANFFSWIINLFILILIYKNKQVTIQKRT